jgi:hypothetical protein
MVTHEDENGPRIGASSYQVESFQRRGQLDLPAAGGEKGGRNKDKETAF